MFSNINFLSGCNFNPSETALFLPISQTTTCTTPNPQTDSKSSHTTSQKRPASCTDFKATQAQSSSYAASSIAPTETNTPLSQIPESETMSGDDELIFQFDPEDEECFKNEARRRKGLREQPTQEQLRPESTPPSVQLSHTSTKEPEKKMDAETERKFKARRELEEKLARQIAERT